ncbi:MAG: heme-binding beta-barrel domain-containing protein [Betaproteobacteria bacterium]
MDKFPEDIYTEAEPDSDTLANLGPLKSMAGIWTGTRGLDVAPKADGPEKKTFIENYEMQPIDAQVNGPQLYYGLRYHTQVFKPGDPETFHDQVGYWLWEPATGEVLLTLAIPRGQVAMYAGNATADARTFRLEARRGSLTNGIVSGRFLEHAFRTESCTMTVSINDDGTWPYEHDTMMIIPGLPEPFHHTDRNTLHKIGEPNLNPTAIAEAKENGGG